MPGERPGPGPEAIGEERIGTRLTPEARKLDQEIRDRIAPAIELKVLDFGYTADGKKWKEEPQKLKAALEAGTPVDNPDLAREPDPEVSRELKNAEKVLLDELKNLLGPDKRRAKELSQLHLKEGLQNIEDVVQLGHIWRIGHRLAELRMVRAGVEGDYRKMQRYDRLLYPPLPRDFIFLALKTARAKAAEHAQSDDPNIRRLAGELLRDLPEPPDTELTISEPTKEELRFAQIRTQEEFQDVLTDVFVRTAQKQPWIGEQRVKVGGKKIRLMRTLDEQFAMAYGYEMQGEFTDQEIRDVFTKMIAQEGADEEGWIVVEGKTTNVHAATKQIQVEKGSKLSVVEAGAGVLFVHEGKHFKRARQGARTGYTVFTEGAPGYLKAEEGITGFAEEAFVGRVKNFLWPRGVLMMGLADGVDGTPRAPKDVLPTIYGLIQFEELVNSKAGQPGAVPDRLVEEARKKAFSSTFGLGYQTWRYTDYKTPGLINHRNTVYANHLAVWRDLRNLKMYSLGKLDPENPKHLWLAEQFGIRPVDLEKAERP